MYQGRLALVLVFSLAAVGADEPARPRADALGDPLPPQAVGRLGSLRLRLRYHAETVTFSPDGKTLVTTEYDCGRVQFWDAKTGKLLRELPPGTGTCVVYSPNGKSFVTGHPYGQMHLWDAATGEKKRKLFDRAGHSMAFSPDGTRLLTTLWVNDAPRRESAVVLIDLSSGAEIRRYEGFEKRPQVHLQLAYSPDGKHIACGDFSGGSGQGTAKVVVWDAASGAELCRLSEPYNVQQLAFTPDGKSLVIGEAGRTRLVEPGTGKVIREFPKEARCGIDLDPTGKRVLTAGDRSVWDLATGKLHRRLGDDVSAYPFGVGWHAAWSPDGKYAAVNFLQPPYLVVWDAETGKPRFGEGHRHPVDGVACSPDGRLIATASTRGGQVCLWEAGGKLLHTLPLTDGYAFCVDGLRFSADSTTVAVGGTHWDVASGTRKLPRWKDPDTATRHFYYRSLLSPDGALLAFPPSPDRMVAIWDAPTGKRLHIFDSDPKNCFVIHSAFSPDGTTLAAAFARDRGEQPAKLPDSVVLWNARTGARLLSLRPSTNSPRRLAYFPDGEHLLVSAYPGVLEVWNLATGTLRQEMPIPWDSRHELTTLAIAPHGQLVAVQAKSDSPLLGEIQLWEATTGQRVHTWGGLYTPPTALTFSADGRTLVSGHAEGTALLWDLQAADNAALAGDAKLWDALAGEAVGAYRVLGGLVARPQRAIPLLEKRLTPASPVKEAEVRQFIADLGDSAFARRERASKELLRLGVVAVPALRQALKNPVNLETRRRIDNILAVVDAKVPPGEVVRDLRAVQLLELLGTPEAKNLLGVLARGDRAHPKTLGAQAALTRMAKR